jgi:hypothetical protein
MPSHLFVAALHVSHLPLLRITGEQHYWEGCSRSIFKPLPHRICGQKNLQQEEEEEKEKKKKKKKKKAVCTYL